MALDAIHRPGALTPSVVLSLGLGLTALVALTLVDANMRAELREAQPGVTPSFFFLDVRGADAGPFVDFVKREAPGVKVSETPMMRGRFVQLGDRPVEQVKPSDKVAWALEGDRGVTFADKPPEGLRGRGGDMVAERLFRAAAGVDGAGGGRGPRPPCRRHGGRQRARAATSRRNSRTCAK